MCPQKMLFDAAPSELAGGVIYEPNFISFEEAHTMFAVFRNLNWQHHGYMGAGLAPRQYVWMGIPYSSPSSATKIVVSEWTPETKHIKTLVEKRTGCEFDSLNLNLYRDHRDSIDWHYDGQQEGLYSFPIASVSFGAARRFKWRKNNDGLVTTQLLEHGSLLVMPPGFQCDYRHALPKQMKACGPRINLTFRRKVA
jgi:alkylated DNA repair dioxygenase AlkB